MQFRFVKDLAVALIFIAILVLGVQLASVQKKTTDIPDNSIHSKESVSDTLMSKIKSIESSIQDRKMFAFNVTRDPLRQGNIIKDQVDLLKEHEERVRNTFRLSTTAIDEFGNKIAYIEFLGRIHAAKVGDTIEGRRITEISDRSIRYTLGGNSHTLAISARPPMPKTDSGQFDMSKFNY